jgi:hypothetical protein
VLTVGIELDDVRSAACRCGLVRGTQGRTAAAVASVSDDLYPGMALHEARELNSRSFATAIIDDQTGQAIIDEGVDYARNRVAVVVDGNCQAGVH